jgi:membrane-bound serine protease (ClpP class)
MVAALFIIWLASFILRLRRRGAVSGSDSIVGGIGKAMHSFYGEGKVWLEGESWAAHSNVAIQKDQDVIVLSLDGLTLEIEPVPETRAGEPQIQT